MDIIKSRNTSWLACHLLKELMGMMTFDEMETLWASEAENSAIHSSYCIFFLTKINNLAS